MNRGGATKKRLSKNLLDMRFMQRTREKTEIELENEERHAMFAHQISDAMRSQGGRFINEPSYMVVENLMFGHRAYNGMNADIEKMTAAEEAHLFEEASTSKGEADVSDNEMAQHYSVSSTVARKFAPKRNFTGRPVESEAPPLLQRGIQLLQHSKSINKVWSKDAAHKKRRFLKPGDDANV